MRYVPIMGFLVLVAVLAMMLVIRHAPPEASDKPFPALTLSALDGKTKWDQQALNGHVTVFNFFASWCTPCEAEMPELAALNKQFPEIQLHGVAWNDDPRTLRVWLAKNKNPFRSVWLDPNGDATIALGIKGIPETIVVDAAGVVRYRLAGPITKALREQTIDPLVHQLLEEAGHAR